MTDEILISKPNVKLTPFYRTGSVGVADSIEAVQKASGLIRLPSYGLVIARNVEPANEGLWNTWHDLDEEQIRATATKSYDGVEQGEHRLFLVGCSSFSHDTDAIRSFVKGKGVLDGKKRVGLTNYSVPLSQTGQVDRLLGDKVVYVTGADGKPVEKVVDGIMTYEQFTEASQDKDFLSNNPFYIVQFPEAQIQNMKSGYLPIDSENVITHPTSIVRSGSAVNWQVMLANGEKKGFESFYVGNPDLTANSGRVGILDDTANGFRALHLNLLGRSLGVAPEALDALVKASKSFEAPSSVEAIVQVPYAGIVSKTASQIMQLPLNDLNQEKLEGLISNSFEQYNSVLKQ